MHAVSLAVTEEITIGTSVFLHPLPVAGRLETVFPYIHKVIPVDIALIEIAADTGTGRDRTICQDRTYADTGITREEIVTYLPP